MFDNKLKQFKEQEQLTQAEKDLVLSRVDSAWQEMYGRKPEVVYEFNFKRYFLTLTMISLLFLGVVFYLTEPNKLRDLNKTNLTLLTAGDQVSTTKSVDFSSKNVILDFEIAGPINAQDALDKLADKYVSAKAEGNLMYGRYETYAQEVTPIVSQENQATADTNEGISKNEVEVWYDLTQKRYKIVNKQYLDGVFVKASVIVNDGSTEYVFTSTKDDTDLVNMQLAKARLNTDNPDYLYDNNDPLTREANFYKILAGSQAFDELVVLTINLNGEDKEVYKVSYSFPYAVWTGDRFEEQLVKHSLYLEQETLLPVKEIFEPNLFPTKYSRELAYLQITTADKDNLFAIPETSKMTSEGEAASVEQDKKAFYSQGTITVTGKLLVQGETALLEASKQTYILSGSDLHDLLRQNFNNYFLMLNGKDIEVSGTVLSYTGSDSVPELVVQNLTLVK